MISIDDRAISNTMLPIRTTVMRFWQIHWFWSWWYIPKQQEDLIQLWLLNMIKEDKSEKEINFNNNRKIHKKKKINLVIVLNDGFIIRILLFKAVTRNAVLERRTDNFLPLSVQRTLYFFKKKSGLRNNFIYFKKYINCSLWWSFLFQVDLLTVKTYLKNVF